MRPSRPTNAKRQTSNAKPTIANQGVSEEEVKIDMTSPYESEIVMYTLTMSDLDELKPFVVDDAILKIAQDKVKGYQQPLIIH